MTATVQTLTEIAAAHGWTYDERAGRTAEYEFTKGAVVVMFTKKGHGRLEVGWHDYRVPWDARIGEIRLYSGTTSRETYAAALLPTITEEKVKQTLEAVLRKDIEARNHALQNAQKSLDKFLSLAGKAA